MRARRVEMPIAVRSKRGASPRPSIVMLRLGGVLDAYLNILQNFGITRAKVTFGQRDTTVTDVPRVTVRLHLARPLPNHLEIPVLTRGEQEQHADAREPFIAVWARKVVGNLPYNFV